MKSTFEKSEIKVCGWPCYLTINNFFENNHYFLALKRQRKPKQKNTRGLSVKAQEKIAIKKQQRN